MEVEEQMEVEAEIEILPETQIAHVDEVRMVSSLNTIAKTFLKNQLKPVKITFWVMQTLQ